MSFKHIENIANQDNNRQKKVPDQAATFQHRILTEGKTSLTQSAEKRSYTLHFPNFHQKLAPPQRDFKLASQPNGQAGRGEKENDSPNCSSTVLSQDHCMEQDNQEPLINDENEKSAFPATRLHHQVQLRLVVPQKQIPQKMVIKEAEIRKEQIASVSDTSKDSGYCSQAEHGSSRETEDLSNEKVSEHDVFALPKVPSFAVPEILSPATTAFVKKVHFGNGKKGQDFYKSSDNKYSAPMEQTEKSPYFNLFKTSTPKTPSFGTFESPFRSITFPDQGGSRSPLNIDTSSPGKDFESIFGGMEGDDNFAFPFTSKSSQSSEEDKDNFEFKLPFGQDMRPFKDFSLKEPEQSQSKMAFTFF
ncbi:protein SIX6OS1-like [Rana temporaria]|uniref:protein SIX6OS1-like n=1 Tax=Rana temporaria TaxID=8407 RepID=UPI001AAD050B|nr:protein SIX6OS1-like [Rana temporaria]